MDDRETARDSILMGVVVAWRGSENQKLFFAEQFVTQANDTVAAKQETRTEVRGLGKV